MDRLQRRLRRLLERLDRHLSVRTGSDVPPAEFHAGFAVAWPGEDSRVVLAPSGKKLLDEVYEVVWATQGSALRWQPDTMRSVADRAIQRLARRELLVEEAAEHLSSFHATLPDERAVLLDVHGLSIAERLTLCGVTFYPAQVREARQDDLFDLPIQEFVLRPAIAVAVRPTDALAEVRVRADEGMAALNARLRVLVALCVLRQSLRTKEALEQQLEYTAGIERTEHTRFLEGVLGTVPQSFGWGDIHAQPLRCDAVDLARTRERPGTRALEQLALSLPDVAPGSRVERVLRAAQLLGRSLDGDADDRFLRRWSALEALVGSPSPNTTDEVARRAAWLLGSNGTRSARERWLKSLYRRRSQLSHGAIDRTPFDFDAVAFGCLCFDLLDRVAARTDAPDIDALYRGIGNRAK